jgi:hypothetical protein
MWSRNPSLVDPVHLRHDEVVDDLVARVRIEDDAELASERRQSPGLNRSPGERRGAAAFLLDHLACRSVEIPSDLTRWNEGETTRRASRSVGPFVGESRASNCPAVMEVADTFTLENARAVDEHLAEAGESVHLADRPHLDPRLSISMRK